MSTTKRDTSAEDTAPRLGQGRILDRMLRAGPTLLVLSVVLPALLFTLAAWQNWRDVYREADARIEQTLRILLEHAVKVFETHKLVIDLVNLRLRFIDWNSEADRLDIHKVLKALEDDFDQVSGVAITDAAGRLRASGKTYPAEANVTFDDREWFNKLKAGQTKLPVISRAYVGRQSAMPVFNVAGRIKGRDGSFQGAVAVSISRSYFEDFYRQLESSSANVIVLVRADGQMLARQPASRVSTLPPDAPFFRSFSMSPGTIYEAKSVVDGIERLFTYRQVGHYPVYIGFGLSKAALIAAWGDHVFAYALIAVVTMIALLAVSGLAMYENARERLATRRWQETAAALSAAASEREQIEGHLRQSQKMETVGQLTSGIAHDFNNMLGATIGSLDLLSHRMKTDSPWDARAQRCVDNAMEGAWRAVNLTQRLLAFSRTQAVSPRPLDVNELIAGMSDLIRRSINEDIRIDARLEAQVWSTYADVNQLESAVLNLVINARDAMPGGGRLVIQTMNSDSDLAGGVPGPDPSVAPGRYVAVAVADTGSGMSEEVLACAFEPFFTTKEVGKGTGLGLSQVHGFVKQSGGHLKVETEVGNGTLVTIFLPEYTGVLPVSNADPTIAARHRDAARHGTVSVATPAGEPMRHGPVVLVVEDEPQLRRVSAEAFRQLGFQVLEASGPREALSLLERAPRVTLLFTNVVMPEMNGASLAEQVRRRQPGVRTLFTTGYTHDAIVRKGILDPAVDLIGKPFTVDQLAAKVNEVLRRAAAA